MSDMDAAARIHRMAFDRALPTLAGLHTPEQKELDALYLWAR